MRKAFYLTPETDGEIEMSFYYLLCTSPGAGELEGTEEEELID